MNIFNKITLQSMKKSYARTLVTIIGVILAATMITAVATFAVSLQSYMVKGSIEKYGDWHVAFSDVDSSFVAQRNHDSEVKNTATFENIGYANIDGVKSADKPYFFIAGFNKKTFDTLHVTLQSGRMPENSSEVLLPEHLEVKGGVTYTIGDTLTLKVGNRMENHKNLTQHDEFTSGKETLMPSTEKTYTIVGICDRPTFEEHSAPGYTLITMDNNSFQSKSLTAFVTLKKPTQIHNYVTKTAKGRAYVLNDDVLRFMGLSDNNLFNAILYTIGGILVVLIMIGSIFLIYNSFNISMNELTHQFGILSSVGATSRQLRNSVLFEGLCIGIIGIPIGIIVGILSIKVVISIVAANFANVLYIAVPLTLTISVPAIVVAAVVSLITILISAYIPARKAANTPVMESIRQTNEVKVESKAMKTSRLSKTIYGLEGTLALKNFKRNKKRYRSIVLSLTLSVILFVSASSFGNCLKKVATSSSVNIDYDICFYSNSIDQDKMSDLYNKLKTTKGVYESSYQAITSYSCKVKPSDLTEEYKKFTSCDLTKETIDLPMDIQFIEDGMFSSYIKSLGLPIEKYTGDNAKMVAAAKAIETDKSSNKGTKLINMFKEPSKNFTVAPRVNNETKVEQGQNIDITFVDVTSIDGPPIEGAGGKEYAFTVVAPYSLREKFETTDTNMYKALTFKSTSPSQSVNEMKSVIKTSGITAQYKLQNLNKIVEENKNIVFVVDVFTYVFVIMISLIATANVFNTISTNIKLRRRELAMLRSIGMCDKDFQKMMNFECVFYGMRTLLFGIPIATLLSWIIYRVMYSGGGQVVYDFPWLSMGISILGVFFIVFITMIYSTSKIRKENIIDALRDEME